MQQSATTPQLLQNLSGPTIKKLCKDKRHSSNKQQNGVPQIAAIQRDRYQLITNDIKKPLQLQSKHSQKDKQQRVISSPKSAIAQHAAVPTHQSPISLQSPGTGRMHSKSNNKQISQTLSKDLFDEEHTSEANQGTNFDTTFGIDNAFQKIAAQTSLND